LKGKPVEWAGELARAVTASGRSRRPCHFRRIVVLPMGTSRTEKVKERVEARTAVEVCAHVALGDAARGMLDDGMGPRPYFERLIERGLHGDAIRFLAHALPKREAIWWAYRCVEPLLRPDPSSAAGSALGRVQAWVIDPTDDHRRAALPAAEAADFG